MTKSLNFVNALFFDINLKLLKFSFPNELFEVIRVEFYKLNVG
jgi:hypothetical protein